MMLRATGGARQGVSMTSTIHCSVPNVCLDAESLRVSAN
jgi:hypothetical protein